MAEDDEQNEIIKCTLTCPECGGRALSVVARSSARTKTPSTKEGPAPAPYPFSILVF
jgi:hypothetical protein